MHTLSDFLLPTDPVVDLGTDRRSQLFPRQQGSRDHWPRYFFRAPVSDDGSDRAEAGPCRRLHIRHHAWHLGTHPSLLEPSDRLRENQGKHAFISTRTAEHGKKTALWEILGLEGVRTLRGYR